MKTIEKLPQIVKEATPQIEKSYSIQITNAKDMTGATEMLSQLNRHLKELTDDKEKLTKPLNEALKEIRGRYKPTEEALEKAILVIRKAMSTYQTAETARIEAEAAKIAERVGDGKGHIKIETAVKKIEALPTVEKKTTAQSGSVSFKATPMFEVTDVSLLPKAYQLPNNVAIRAAMNEGTKLDGVRYWTEQVPINRR